MTKIIITIAICSFFIACTGPFLTDDDLKTERASTESVKSQKIISENGTQYIIEKDIGVGSNYFFSCPVCSETFLFLTCNFDCNEKMEAVEWNKQTNAVAFLTKNSTRFKSGNRLILYQVTNNKPVKLLDTVKDVYKTFTFESNDFVYTLESGEVKKISLM